MSFSNSGPSSSRDGNRGQRGGGRGSKDQRGRGGRGNPGPGRPFSGPGNFRFGKSSTAAAESEGKFDSNGSEGDQNNRRNRNRETDRKGPIFGFKRIHGFLTSSPEEVIMNIDKDLNAWQEFLESNELTAKGDNLLVLVVQVLGEKICTDTFLPNQQTGILIKTNTSNFIAKINEKLQKMLMGVDTDARNFRRNMNSDFVELDLSPTSFLTNLHKYCVFMSKKMPDIAVDKLLGIIGIAYGVVATTSLGDHSLTALQTSFQDLKLEIQSLVKKREEAPKRARQRRYGFTDEEEQELHAMEAPDDFRDMTIVPSAAELLSKDEVFLRPNKTSGAYIDAHHYLDVQFRLLREDFVQPLKKGIQDFMKNRFDYLTKNKKIPLGTIRIYRNVQIVKAELVRDVSVYKVQLSEADFKKIKWERSKRLLTGSLLVFTSDFFQTAYFAVVASRNTEELTKGVLSIVWEGNQPVWDRDDEYLMVECEVYFEAYRHTLQILKELQLQDFSMCKFIVSASSDVGPPKYIQESENLLTLELKGREDDDLYISPLLDDEWPTHEALGLDINQFEAFKAALTKEFAIIQGPPGTGKTFLGLKIAKVLLRNQSTWRSDETGPILVVCYTNHALDQFLEGILEVCPNINGHWQSIVRVGGRSKSDKLQDFSLSNVVRKNNRNMPSNYWPNRNDALDRIHNLQFKRSTAMAAVMGLRDVQGIINFEELDVWQNLSIEFPKAVWNSLLNPAYLGLTDILFELAPHLLDQMFNNWFEVRPVSTRKVKKVAPAETEKSKSKPQDNFNKTGNEAPSDEDFEEDYDVDELLENRILDDIYAEVDSRTSVNNIGGAMSYLSGYSIKDCEKMIKDCERKLHKMQNEKPQSHHSEQLMNLSFTQIEKQLWLNTVRRDFLAKIFTLYKNDMINFPDVKTVLEKLKKDPVDLTLVHLNKLSKPQRWALFFNVVERARVLSAEMAATLEKDLIHEQKKLQDIQRYGEGHILKNSKVVGMTTTGAAKYHDLVKMMQSKIVIVEEAAEVLESHIVTCITKFCEHLILIGDHRQLKPSTTVYDLATKYNFDTSLFERMLNNKLNCYQLKVQHRMRPEIANLVVGTIYEELHNHPSVTLYPPVLGVTKNLFFITHTELEKSESDSMSKSNEYEAKFLAGLCRYLILQGYTTDQITVLTTYTGQMFLLKKTIQKFLNCKGIRVTCVDNFQGEENDIILLSLVRSNTDSKIGFLSIENRICVALSRAKHGLYVIGNMSVLSAKSKTWSQIEEKLSDRGECGPALVVECQNHGTLSEIHCDNDFDLKVPEGGCSLNCDTELECTHKCTKVCHVKDREHKEYRCQLACLKRCENDHPCTGRCCQRCPPCTRQVQKTLLCLHEKLMPCYQKIEDVSCMVQVTKKLPCDHEEIMACHKDPMAYICPIEVEKELHCGHKRILKCHVDPGLITCKFVVTKTLIPCGHEQEVECRFQPDNVKCDTKVIKKFPDCGHEMEVKCADSNKPLNCMNKCTSRLDCGHACTRLCHINDDPEHLHYICKKDCAKACPEGHKCGSKHKCHAKCPPCKIEVERKLYCGHAAKMECYIEAAQFECLQPCERMLKCWHKCQSLCYLPCGPCQTEVKKRNECGHPITLACSVTPTQDICEELVKPLARSICNHDTLVPCKISRTASPSEIMENCTHPCGTLFAVEDGGCGHTCLGTCKSCFQGKLHEKCQEECGKPLVCGHVCGFPCSKLCPPCDKQCFMKCEHSECKQKCGTPCQGCSEKCPWQCPHKKCSKLCREMCDREPCDEPCPEMLKCNHPCIGFCGEPCPTQCRICDKQDLTEDFFLLGNEGDEDARFVFLPDCKHAIEVEGLTYHMNVDNNGQIGTKRCPRCNTVMRNCRRFGNVMKARLTDVIEIKQRCFGDQKNVKKLQNNLITKLRWDEEKWERHFSTLKNYLLENLIYTVTSKKGKKNQPVQKTLPKPIDEYTMGSLSEIAKFAENAIEAVITAKAKLKDDLSRDLHRRYRELFANVMTRKLPLSRREIQDIGQELDRLFDLNQVYLRASVPSFSPDHPRAAPIYKRLIDIVLYYKPYVGGSQKNLRALLLELEEVLKTGLGISENEKRDILKAVGMGQGHWYKCPNGHIYVITECGGASQVGKCNECGAAIGGQSHQLLRDNQIATEMDGATRPAWPTGMQY